MNLDLQERLVRRKVIMAQLRGREAHYGFNPTFQISPELVERLQPYVEQLQRQKHVPYPRMLHKYVSLEKSIGRSGDWVRISKVAQQVYRCAALYGYTRSPY